MPLVFLGPNGAWNLFFFDTPEQAKGYAEPADVSAGEYGEHGWDADGHPVALVVVPYARERGFVGWVRSLYPSLETDLKKLDGVPEPEALRRALIGRLNTLDPKLVVAAEKMDIDDLIALVRGLLSERLWEVSQGRYPTKGGK